MSLGLAIVAVVGIIYAVPVLIYGAASAAGWVELPPEASPRAFLLGILITKLGTAVVFVAVLQLSRARWSGGWLLYGVLWFVMFAASELGDGVSGRSSWPESVLGIASEAIYAPVSAFVAYRILGVG